MVRTLTQELLIREADGIEVSLVWRRDADTLAVVVNDERLGASFEVEAPRENALDVFHHPFAYAAVQGIEYVVAA
jgi:hypothetical protein